MEKPTCKLIGANGNIFNLLGIAGEVLRANGLYQQRDEMIKRVTGGEAKSYDEALKIITEYVEVI